MTDDIVFVALKDLQDSPFQSRNSYGSETPKFLAASIAENGLQQYPLVRKVNGKYQLVFGHRRKQAYEYLYRSGMKSFEFIPCRLVELSDRQSFEVSITENLARAQLNPIEKAEAMKRYMELFSATSEEVGKLFGVKSSTVRGTVRMLNLPEKEKDQMRSGDLTFNKAKEILAKPKEPHLQLRPDEDFDLRWALKELIFGDPTHRVNDHSIFLAVKNVFDRNRELDRQLSSAKKDVVPSKNNRIR